MKSGAAAQYPTMSIEELKNLPVGEMAQENAVLFMWATVPLLPEALEVMKAWGFTYKTKLTWRKTMGLGMGFWFRGQIEDLLVGVRGKIKAFRCQRPNIIEAKTERHSQKPEEFRKLIEEAAPELTDRIELFARRRSDNWDAWGNEIPEEERALVL